MLRVCCIRVRHPSRERGILHDRNPERSKYETMRVPITFRERTRETLRQTAGTAARLHTADVFDAARLAHVHNTPAWSAAVAEARAIRLRTLHNLAGYLEQLECTIMARGGRVVWARDGDEAARYIVQLAQTSGVSLAVQGRTTLADEIALAAALRQANVRLQPTNVGDYLANLAEQRPAHPLASIANWHIDDVARVVHTQLDVPVLLNAQAIVDVVRSRVRQSVLHSGLHIVGVDFAIAETGTLVVMDEQAGARLAASQVPLQVAIMGIEQVVPTFEDWRVIEQVYLGSAFGRTQQPHLDLFAGGSRPDSGTEFHLILLDNGRTTLLASAAAELLACIRCGACVSACPVSRRVGSAPYAWSYPGPVGAVGAAWLLPPVHGDAAAASTLCGACRAACPIGIDLPALLLRARQRPVPSRARWQRLVLRRIIRQMHTPAQRASLARWITAGRVLAGSGTRRKWLAPWLLHWTSSRDLPPPAGTPFHARWAQRQTSRPVDG